MVLITFSRGQKCLHESDHSNSDKQDTLNSLHVGFGNPSHSVAIVTLSLAIDKSRG